MSDRFSKVLNHRAVDPNIPASTIADQLDTAEAVRQRLDQHGGVILGDEVGAGKTYVAFALLVEALSREPNKGAVILVPNPELLRKWCRQLKEYLLAAVPDKDRQRHLIGRITPIDRSLRDDGTLDPQHWGRPPDRDAIVIATHRVCSGRAANADQAACLRAAAKQLRLDRRIQAPSLLRACGVDPDKWWESAGWAQPDRLTEATLQPLHEVLKAYVSGRRGLAGEARRAIQQVRLRVGQASLPDAALVVVDEAHALRSKTKLYWDLMAVLSDQFDALLFLTATPFQLGRWELLNVVDFFRHARAYADRGERFGELREQMRGAMDEWIQALDQLERASRDLDPDGVDRFLQFVRGRPRDGDPGDLAQTCAAAFDRSLSAKARLEAAMRPFVVRSVRNRTYREHEGVCAAFLQDDEARIPLALVDRLLFEIMETSRTFVASALIGACSSWESLKSATVMEDRPAGARCRSVLRRLSDGGLMGHHPKVAQTIELCKQGVGRGEKTLVFVERAPTGRALRDRLMAELPGSDTGSDASWARLQVRSRYGWASLRENCLHTIFPLVFNRPPEPDEIAAAWSDPYARSLWERVDPEGDQRDYSVEKRFWEHVMFRRAAERHGSWNRDLGEPLRLSVQNVLECDYVLNGLDLRSGRTGQRKPVPNRADRARAREPRMAFAEALLGYRSPWVVGRDELKRLHPDDRAKFVEAAASAIAESHFRHELEAAEIERNPRAYFSEMETLLLTERSAWPDRFRQLALQAADAGSSGSRELAATRIERLVEALSGRERIKFVGGGTSHDARDNAVSGFNTPLYPDVIVATRVLEEGLDLHRFCKRVIHHDLPWNPAKLEQRTGRIDRVGSLSARLEHANPSGDWEIDVWLPYIPGTYDEFIYDRVMARRREFKCILGDKPEWRDDRFANGEEGSLIHNSLIPCLQVNLSPTPGSAPITK